MQYKYAKIKYDDINDELIISLMEKDESGLHNHNQMQQFINFRDIPITSEMKIKCHLFPNVTLGCMSTSYLFHYFNKTHQFRYWNDCKLPKFEHAGFKHQIHALLQNKGIFKEGCDIILEYAAPVDWNTFLEISKNDIHTKQFQIKMRYIAYLPHILSTTALHFTIARTSVAIGVEQCEIMQFGNDDEYKVFGTHDSDRTFCHEHTVDKSPLVHSSIQFRAYHEGDTFDQRLLFRCRNLSEFDLWDEKIHIQTCNQFTSIKFSQIDIKMHVNQIEVYIL